MQPAIQWELLAPAMLLLWVVLPMRGDHHEPGVEPPRRDAERPSLRSMGRAWQNWVDLGRGCAGVLLLINAFATPLSATPEWIHQATLIKLAVLGVGLILQVVRWGEGVQFFAPSFYLTGITPLLSGPLIGGFAGLFGWLFALGTGDTRVLLPVMALMAAVSGLLFGQLDLWVACNVALLLTPLGVSFLAGRFPLHVCRGLRPAVPVLTTSLQTPEFRRVVDTASSESPTTSSPSDP